MCVLSYHHLKELSLQNFLDEYIYHKFSGRKYIFLVLYVEHILLASNYISFLRETKNFLSNNFEMNDHGDASFSIRFNIHRDRSQGVLALSHESYIKIVLKRYGMQNCKPRDTLWLKETSSDLISSPRMNLRKKEMENIP